MSSANSDEVKNIFNVPTGREYTDGVNTFTEMISDGNIAGEAFVGSLLFQKDEKKAKPICRIFYHCFAVTGKTDDEPENTEISYFQLMSLPDNIIVGYTLYNNKDLV